MRYLNKNCTILPQEAQSVCRVPTFHHLALITTLQALAADSLLLSRTLPGLMIPSDAQGERHDMVNNLAGLMINTHKVVS